MGTRRKTSAPVARFNGHFGGAPTKAEIMLRRRERAKATRLVAKEQVECVRFLVWVRDNPNAPLPERIRCALELLSRGELPAKSGIYPAQFDESARIEEAPKLVELLGERFAPPAGWDADGIEDDPPRGSLPPSSAPEAEVVGDETLEPSPEDPGIA